MIDEKIGKVINQQNSKSPNVYNVDTIINADKEHIKTLKDEIAFLKDLIRKED